MYSLIAGAVTVLKAVVILVLLVGSVNAQGDWNVYCTIDSKCCAVAKQASVDYVVPALETSVDWNTAWNWMNTHGYGSYGGCLPSAAKVAVWNVYCDTSSDCCAVAEQPSGDYVVQALETSVDWNTAWNWMNTKGYGSYGGCLPSAAKVAVWNIYCDGTMKDCVVARQPTPNHAIPVLQAPVDWDTAWNEMEKRGLAAEKLMKLPGAGVVKWNQHEYAAAYTPDGITWDDAKAAAEAKGGHLVTITSEAENQFVYSLVEDDKFWIWDGYDGEGPWLGGYQRQGSSEPAGGWAWVNGDPFSEYTNWGRGEPNNAGYEERLEFIGKGTKKGNTWNDRDGSIRKMGYIIEWDRPRQGTIGMEEYESEQNITDRGITADTVLAQAEPPSYIGPGLDQLIPSSQKDYEKPVDYDPSKGELPGSIIGYTKETGGTIAHSVMCIGRDKNTGKPVYFQMGGGGPEEVTGTPEPPSWKKKMKTSPYVPAQVMVPKNKVDQDLLNKLIEEFKKKNKGRTNTCHETLDHLIRQLKGTGP